MESCCSAGSGSFPVPVQFRSLSLIPDEVAEDNTAGDTFEDDDTAEEGLTRFAAARDC